MDSPNLLNERYKLIFEGPANEDLDLIKHLKGTLITDFSLSIKEIDAIFDQAPIVIKRASSEEDLLIYKVALVSAGAKVNIMSDEPIKKISAPEIGSITLELDDSDEYVPPSTISTEDKKISAAVSSNLTIALDDSDAPVIKNSPIDNDKNNNTDNGFIGELSLSLEDAPEHTPPPNEIQQEATKTAAQSKESISNSDIKIEAETSSNTPILDQDKKKKSGLQPENTNPTVSAKSPLENEVLPQSNQKEKPHIDKTPNTPVKSTLGATVKGNKPSPFDDIRSPFIIFIIIAAVVGLGLINWLYFASQNEQKTTITFDPSMLLRPVPQKTVKPKAALTKMEDTPSEQITWQGKYAINNLQIFGKMITLDSKVDSLSISVTPPPPTPLTPTQIVRGGKTPPWLTLVEIENLQIKKNQDGTLSGKGPAKGFIEYNKNKTRIVGEAEISGILDVDKKTSAIQFTIRAGNHPDKSPPLQIYIDKQGRFSFNMSGEISLTPAETIRFDS